MNVEKIRQELAADHPDAMLDEAKLLAVISHMRERVKIKDSVRARAIATWCFYVGTNTVVKLWNFNEACRGYEWEIAAQLMLASPFAKNEPRAAKRAAAMLRTGKDA